MSDYQSIYQRSINEPEDFWCEAAKDIQWTKPWDKVLDDSNQPFTRWFVGGELNTCYNAVDYHVENGRADQAALIYDSPVTATSRTISYAQLRDEVAAFAGALVAQGVTKGDRVIIYMPMIPEAAIAMLACARIGAIHSVVFGGFAANELATRIDDAAPKVIVSASCGIEPGRLVEYKPLLDGAVELASQKPDKCIILQRPQLTAALGENDIEWQAAIAEGTPADCVPVAATDPLYILYTSGTTGQPKGVLRDNGGHAVALKWTMKNLYNVEPGEVYWAASDVGWVVGHSYIVYGPLLQGCTTLMYEGKPVGTPDPGAFWRVISEHQVSVMFTAPTAIRAIKKEDPEAEHLKRYDMSKFRHLFLAGERCDPDTMDWARSSLGVPVIDHWWQTETGWAINAHCMGFDAEAEQTGLPGKAVPGYNVQILDDSGQQVADGEMGAVVIKLPLPPGNFPTLWQNDQRFKEAYFDTFPGYYLSGDAGYRNEQGHLWIMGRTDDVINVAGHRLSTGALEEVLACHHKVAECAVLGVSDQLKGQLPVGLIVLKAGAEGSDEQVVSELVSMIREKVGPVAAFKLAVVVKRLPKTRSGKILRATMRAIADGEPYKVPATIDDPLVIDEITASLKQLGYPKAV